MWAACSVSLSPYTAATAWSVPARVMGNLQRSAMPIKVEQDVPGRAGLQPPLCPLRVRTTHESRGRREEFFSAYSCVLSIGKGAEHLTSMWHPHGIIRFGGQSSGLKTSLACLPKVPPPQPKSGSSFPPRISSSPEVWRERQKGGVPGLTYRAEHSLARVHAAVFGEKGPVSSIWRSSSQAFINLSLVPLCFPAAEV